MSEMTDEQLEVAVTEAMGWTRYKTLWALPDWPYAIPVDEFHPLAVDANGNPTQRAKAQLWGIETWLVHKGTVTQMHGKTLYGFRVTVGDNSIAGQRYSRARALCEAAVAVGEVGREGNERPTGDYRRARGVLPLKEGAEPSEARVRRGGG